MKKILFIFLVFACFFQVSVFAKTEEECIKDNNKTNLHVLILGGATIFGISIVYKKKKIKI